MLPHSMPGIWNVNWVWTLSTSFLRYLDQMRRLNR